MKSIYVYNSNFNNDVFTSLLMVNFNSFNLPFNNIKTTKEVFYDNIIVYIPEINIANKTSDYISDSIIKDSYMFRFKHIIFCFADTKDYESFKRVFDCQYGDNNIHYYISIGLTTLLANIISIDCNSMINVKPVIRKMVTI